MTPQEETLQAINNAGGSLPYADLVSAVGDSTKRRLLDVLRDLERNGQAYRQVAVVDGATVFTVNAGQRPESKGA